MFKKKKQKPRFSFMGRPRGRKYQNVSISLTTEQIAYLDIQPNASELIRRLLSQHMKQMAAPKEGESFESLKAKLERVEQEKEALENEFFQWDDDHAEALYENGSPYPLRDGKPPFKLKGATKLIRIYRGYERRLKELNDTIVKLRQAIRKAEKTEVT